MRYVRRFTRVAPLVAVAGFALLAAACADQQPTTPTPPARPKLEQGSANNIVVKSEITLYDKSGATRHTYTKTQQLETHLVGGVLGARVVAPSAELRASMQVTDSSAVAAGYNQPLTPVVGVRTGSGVGNYTRYVTDSSTMKVYKLVAKGPMIYNYPIDVAYVYDSRGYLVAEQHFKWSKVSGGYALLAQKEISYWPSGALYATVTSNVSSPVTYVAMAESPSGPVQFASLLHQIGCYFGPQVAYAQGKGKGGSGGTGGGVGNNMPLPGAGCDGQGGVVGFTAGSIMVESMIEMELWALPIYLGSWTAFGHALWDYLDCLTYASRCSASTCTGGGGTSW